MKKSKRDGRWRLKSFDPFDEKWRPYRHTFKTEDEARGEAARKLAKIERENPTELSGGQAHGLQRRIFVVRPDGTSYRFGGPATA